ncbi:MAG TPA: winged helix-turn-helix domain-containing protein [Nitrososphaeraceae archaeon]
MATRADDDDNNDTYAMMLANILEICKDGCRKDKIMQKTRLSHDQLRRIMAEMIDRELLHYIEASSRYVTTDKGYIFLNRRHLENTFHDDRKMDDTYSKTKEELSSIASKQNIIHRKIQLWTNRYQNEFAIRLTGDSTVSIDDDDDDSNTFLASTNTKEDYITVVAETDYFEDLKHGWEYTLSHLIEQYKANNKTQEVNITSNNDKPFSIRLIPYIKCGYCKSEFVSEKEKKEHELEWHV